MMKTKRLPFTAKVMFTIAGFNKKKLGRGLTKAPTHAIIKPSRERSKHNERMDQD
jgi:hypothetical protein